MTKPYFWGKTKGLKADIERHRQEGEELLLRIEDIENNPENSLHPDAFLRTYKEFLALLRESKAEVVSKIGSKRS